MPHSSGCGVQPEGWETVSGASAICFSGVLRFNEVVPGAPFFGLWCSARRVGDHERPHRSSYALKPSARLKRMKRRAVSSTPV